MPKYLITEEGVAALNHVAQTLDDGCDNVNKSADKLADTAENCKDLGPHAERALQIVENVKSIVNASGNETKKLSINMRYTANDYQNLIDMGLGDVNYIDDDGNNGSQPGPMVKTLKRRRR